jgi:cyclophilin family peptidyl-prolyl cis-trans isomerase
MHLTRNLHMAKIALKLLLILCVSSCFNSEEKKSDNEKNTVNGKISTLMADELNVDTNGLSKERITIKTVHGNISFSLYPKKSPITVTRIIELVNKGFYDGLSFHRVVSNFVIQAGDPTGTGSGGSGKKLKAEFNDLQHIKGTVAMARTQDPDSADSQFYIGLTTLPHLNGKYTIFGQVTDGFDVMEKIKQGDKIISMVFQK